MTNLKIFESEEFGKVRVQLVNNEPMFVGKDVAEALGYSNASKAVMVHVDDDDKVFEMLNVADSQNGNVVKTALINESGVYSLIMSSQLPSAKKFKKWVTSEVLPSIRRNGAYMTDNVLEQAISNPDFMIGLLTNLKAEQIARQEAEKIAQQQQERLDLIEHSKTTYSTTEIAKEIGMASAQELNEALIKRSIQYRTRNGWVLTAKYCNEGYTESKNFVTTKYAGWNTTWTQKGREWLLSMFRGYVKVEERKSLRMLLKSLYSGKLKNDVVYILK